MTKKAQFIIPNVFIKEAKFGALARLMVRGRRAYRAFKGVRPRSLATTPAATPPPSPTASVVAPSTVKPQTRLDAGIRRANSADRLKQGPIKTKAPVETPTTAVEPAAYSPGLINRALSSTAGRVAAPVVTGAVGYGFGNSSGYDEGFGQGSLSAQQMAAIQAMQAQQQARQMYDNQGFLDRLMGNNPF